MPFPILQHSEGKQDVEYHFLYCVPYNIGKSHIPFPILLAQYNIGKSQIPFPILCTV